MPRIVQFRRGTTAQVETYSGAAGEIVVDMDLKTIRVHDGATVGGFPLLTKTEYDTIVALSDAIQTANATQDATLTSIDTRLDGHDTDVADHESRVTVLETTEFWKAAADGYYTAIGVSYTKSEANTLLQNEVTNIDTKLLSDYYNKTVLYTKTETDSAITTALLPYVQTSSMVAYRLVADSYTKNEVDTIIVNLNQDYYTKTISDSIFRRLDDSLSETEINTKIADVVDNTYDRGYIDSTYAVIAQTYSRQDAESTFATQADTFTKTEVTNLVAASTGLVSQTDNTVNTALAGGVNIVETDDEIIVSFQNI